MRDRIYLGISDRVGDTGITYDDYRSYNYFNCSRSYYSFILVDRYSAPPPPI